MWTTVFFGTSDVAVPFLERWAQTTRLVGVVTTPDRPAGRGYSLTPPPVKRTAQALNLPVAQPERLAHFSCKAAFGHVPDVGLVVAYGRLIPPALFNEPGHGLVNVHFSLVPKYRGAAPIQWALINGETETGVSLFRIEEGMDTGPVYLQVVVPIDPTDNALTLRDKLVSCGLSALDRWRERLTGGPWAPTPQSGEPGRAPPLRKADGLVRWSRQSAVSVNNLVRGAWEWPGAFGYINGRRLQIRRAIVWGGAEPENPPRPGHIIGLEKGAGFLVQCSPGNLLIQRVQPEGKQEMDAVAFWHGARLRPGDCFMEE